MPELARQTRRAAQEASAVDDPRADPFRHGDDDQIALLVMGAGRRLGDRAGVGGILQFDGDPGGPLDRPFQVDVAPPEVGGGHETLAQVVDAAGHGDADAFAGEPGMGPEE